MKAIEMEPGFLQVFRIYAWMRVAWLFFLPTLRLRLSSILAFDELDFPVALIVLDTIFLLAYLYWHGFQETLGRAYIPIALIFATVTLLLEGHFLSGYRGFIQLEPFTYILLILTAWQYDFRAVILFSLGTALLQGGLNWFLLQDDPLLRFLPDSPMVQRAVVGGFLISRSITFLLIGYVIVRLVKAQRSQRAELARTNLRLMRHASTVEQLTLSQERNRLARELHDTLAHTLSALTVQLEALLTAWKAIPEQPRQMLEQMLNSTRAGLDETRRALSALRASPLEEMGLSLALRSLAEDYAERNGWQLTLDLAQQLEGLSAEVEQAYYRIAQEALQNSALHANARHVRLSLRKEAGLLQLQINDDGKGFDPNHLSEEQLGIRGMFERAELIGAKLEIHSEPNQGTLIDLQAEVEP
ncbi:MAG: hypothetical protein DDG59_08835 [Anaerolineae bacterium]|jgi:signal transduction histidine kinase|nr:MAG: hypothetical protein DDG59_08835 [Anaerolineae bacterium]